jgi:hypothetical protein
MPWRVGHARKVVCGSDSAAAESCSKTARGGDDTRAPRVSDSSGGGTCGLHWAGWAVGKAGWAAVGTNAHVCWRWARSCAGLLGCWAARVGGGRGRKIGGAPLDFQDLGQKQKRVAEQSRGERRTIVPPRRSAVTEAE